jgi:hypothetical protein
MIGPWSFSKPKHSNSRLRNVARDEFLSIFPSALDMLPNLKCLVLESMRPGRQLSNMGETYRLTPQSLNPDLVSVDDARGAYLSNLGFRQFLMPAIQHLARDKGHFTPPGPSVTHLSLRNPRHVRVHGSRVDSTSLSMPSPFRQLTHLEIDLDGSSCPDFRDDAQTLGFLPAATLLTHLSLGFNLDDQPQSGSQDEDMRYDFLDRWPTFPRLEHLQVDGYWLHKDGPLVAFVARHCKTLVHFQLDMFHTGRKLLKSFQAVAPG